MTEIKTYEVENIALADLKLDASNPNVMSEQQLSALKLSFRKFGYLQPIVVDRQTNTIIDGHHRYLVYKELMQENIPAYKVDTRNETERKLLRQAANKIHGTHDPAKDIIELTELLNYDQNIVKDLINADYGTIDELKKLLQEQPIHEVEHVIDTDIELDSHKILLEFNDDEFRIYNMAIAEFPDYNDDVKKLIAMIQEWKKLTANQSYT